MRKEANLHIPNPKADSALILQTLIYACANELRESNLHAPGIPMVQTPEAENNCGVMSRPTRSPFHSRVCQLPTLCPPQARCYLLELFFFFLRLGFRRHLKSKSLRSRFTLSCLVVKGERLQI